ncbi:hypothetical protein M0805_001958 [Coniferiporia weirii]|nr:hypothetical protein M0805_001958 [Coniferiporia weirii]
MVPDLFCSPPQIEKFKKIENRARTVEGGAQLMEALEELEEVAGKYIAVDIRTTLSSFRSASDMLIEAFKKLGEDLFREKHFAPVRELKLFCWGNLRDSRRRSMTNEEETETILSISKHVVYVTQGLSEVFESAFPEFLKAQEKAQSIDFNSMLTAATFFSAVTATTLQLYYAYNTSPHASFGVAVNTLWFVALVFSTSSSLNILVGLTWYQRVRRNQLLPDWAKLWVEDGPTISLAIASASFSIGLCLFAFSSSQHTITSALTAAFTVAHAVALFVPLCIYSSNRRRATQALIVFHALLLLIPYLFIAYIKLFIKYIKRKAYERPLKNASEVGSERDAFSLSTRGAGPNSSSSLIGIEEKTKMSPIFVRLSARSVVAWPITCLLTLYLDRTCATDESGNTERGHEPGEKLDALSKLEHDVESQRGARKPSMRTPILTEDQDIVLSEGLRILTPDVTDPDKAATHTVKGSGKEVGRRSGTHPNPKLKGHTAATPSTVHPIPGSSSSWAIRNPENGPENIGRQGMEALGRPNVV